MWRKRHSPTLLVGMQIGAATMGNNRELPLKLKIELTHDPTIPLLEALLRASLMPKQHYLTNLDDVLKGFKMCSAKTHQLFPITKTFITKKVKISYMIHSTSSEKEKKEAEEADHNIQLIPEQCKFKLHRFTYTQNFLNKCVLQYHTILDRLNPQT